MAIAEYAIVFPTVDIRAQVVGASEPRLVQAGTAGTVLLVHRTGSSVTAYEVEFPIGDGIGAVATIEEAQLELAPNGYCRACPCCTCRTLLDCAPAPMKFALSASGKTISSSLKITATQVVQTM